MLRHCKRALAIVLAGAAIAGSAQATTVNLTAADFGQWRNFDVDAFSFSPDWIDLNDFSALSFNVVLAAPAYLNVVDGVFAGERFTVVSNGSPLGSTSVPGASAASYAPDQAGFDAAFADPAYSKGTWLLPAGTYTITGSLLPGGQDATAGALMLSPVPEPGTYAMLLAGIGLLAGIVRRRV